MKKSHTLLFSALLFCACSNGTKPGNELQNLSQKDSLIMVFEELLNTPDDKARRESFGEDLQESEYKEYRERTLSKKEIRKWILRMKATGKAEFDKENADKILNGEWTLFRLDTLEDRIITLKKNEGNRDLTEKAINLVPELKKSVDWEFLGIDFQHKSDLPSE